MKNFKLLLATTALLSTGALVMNAMADGETADTIDMRVHARIVSASGGSVIQNIDFGTLIKPQTGYNIRASMDETGIVRYIGEAGTIRTFENSRDPGIFTFTYSVDGVVGTATAPEYVELNHSLGQYGGAMFYPAIVKMSTESDGNDVVETYHIGGYIPYIDTLEDGDYEASFTVTLLLEEE